ncbi:LamG-like jellyroll fold domain-containing protein [Streptomyces sp. NPDC051546]|uniref:LamG-like jellyroll fold domain-containing protein n=1 Tax=Streptomyces sp. NPDC051546 TaxID=3365655 RepID=UPI0037980C55
MRKLFSAGTRALATTVVALMAATAMTPVASADIPAVPSQQCGYAGTGEAKFGPMVPITNNLQVGPNNWNARDNQGGGLCINTDGDHKFTVSGSNISADKSGQVAQWGPQAYPSFETRRPYPDLPATIDSLADLSSTFHTRGAADSEYNTSYDLWFDPAQGNCAVPTDPSHANTTVELMIWLNDVGGNHPPAGSLQPGTLTVGGHTFEVWKGVGGAGTVDVSFRSTDRTLTAVDDFSLKPFLQESIRRGWLTGSHYLCTVDAGFEIWRNGNGLAADWYELHLAKQPPVVLADRAYAMTDAAHSPPCPGGAGYTNDPARGPVATFNGTGQFCAVDGAGTPSVDATKDFSVAAWVKPDSVDGTLNITALSQDGVQGSAFYLGVNAADKKWIFQRPGSDEAGPTAWAGVKSDGPATTAWTHLTATYQASTKKMTLYVNGVAQSATATAPTPWTRGNGLVIGRGKWAGASADLFPGRVSGVSSWIHTLSPSEASTAYSQSLPSQPGAGDTSYTMADAAHSPSCPGGVSYVNDPNRGNVAKFDGGAQYCALTSPSVDATKDFSVAAWVKPDSVDGTLNITALSQDGVQGSAFYLGVNAADKKWIFQRPGSDEAGPTAWAGVKSDGPATTAWTHLTATYQASTKKMTLYVNGVAQSATATAITPWTGAGKGLTIGRAKWAGGPGDKFPGLVSYVRTWTHTLSGTEAGAAYAQSPTSGSSAALFTEDFSGASEGHPGAADGLITNEYASWPGNAGDPARVLSKAWDLTSGSLFRKTGTDAAGNANKLGSPGSINNDEPNATSSGPASNGVGTATDSAIFRMKSKRTDFGDVRIDAKFRDDGLIGDSVSDGTNGCAECDGIHMWLRYKDADNLYFASLNRRDNTMVIKKKVTTGSSSANIELSSSAAYNVPWGQWQNFTVTVKNTGANQVTITVSKDGHLLLTGVDNGAGGVPAYTAPGAIGVRADHADFVMDDIVVSPY